ncbi:dihydrodipicolinate synthase family protein [Paraburkholderia nemoris]|uniref:dihydrodipicolinate synthase family protein n=1 Tax=Paraburkholderia nemoris TaxID=2793076 RepID=UPI0038BBDDE3
MPAFPTPVQATGALDCDSLHQLVEHQIAQGASGLIALGGTGESTSLTPEMRLQVIIETVAAAHGRVPVIAGVLSPGFNDAVQSGKAFMAAGADGLMTIAPYYVRVSQSDVVRYFKAFNDAVKVPVLLYDNPARSRIVIVADSIAEMFENGSICGMKASNTDLYHFDQVMQRVDDRFAMLSGQDTLFAQQVALGARGGVLTSAVIAPGFWCEVQRLAETGDLKKAIFRQRQLYPLLEALFAEENPGPLRVALEMIGVSAGVPLLPLADISAELRARLQVVVSSAVENDLIPLAAPTK